MNFVTELLQDYLNHVMHDPENAFLDLQKLPEEFKELGKTLIYFSKSVIETGNMAKAISKGILDIELPPPDNEMAAPLKALHASLKHLTWQTQQVAKGDYQQRVDFMGEFSEAFNTMVEQLEQRRLALLNEISTMMQKRSLYEMLAGESGQRIIVTDASTSEILFASCNTLSDEGSEDKLHKWLKRQTEAMRGKHEISIAELELTNNNTVQYYTVSIHPLCWNQNNVLAFVLIDISMEREQLRKYQNIANVDTLTQLYNRRYGMDVLEKWISEDRSFVLCFVDINNLKFVNDRYGHAEGDQYIIGVSSALCEFSPEAVVCRIGGDEFIVLAEGWGFRETEERLEALRNRMIEGNSFYERSVSYGVISVASGNMVKVSDLLNAADEKMYEYKRAYKLRQKKKLEESILSNNQESANFGG